MSILCIRRNLAHASSPIVWFPSLLPNPPPYGFTVPRTSSERKTNALRIQDPIPVWRSFAWTGYCLVALLFWRVPQLMFFPINRSPDDCSRRFLYCCVFFSFHRDCNHSKVIRTFSPLTSLLSFRLRRRSIIPRATECGLVMQLGGCRGNKRSGGSTGM